MIQFLFQTSLQTIRSRLGNFMLESGMADDRSQYIALLRQQYLFQGLDPDQLERVVDKFEVIKFQPGYRLFSEGDAPDYFYILFRGRARVSRW